jgi:hypothetical protein
VHGCPQTPPPNYAPGYPPTPGYGYPR